MDNENDGRSEFGISEDIAKDKVYEFLKKEGNPGAKDQIIASLESGGTKTHPNLGEYYIFTGAMGEFWVSAAGGNVITYNAPPRFSITEAEDFVKRFFSSHVPEFSSRNFVQISSEAEDIFWKEEWREEPQNDREKSIFPNWIVITINLEKRSVNNFNFSDLRRIRFTEPTLNEAKARQKIRQRFPDGKILEIELMEHTSDGGRTWITIWNAIVQPYDDPEDPHEIITINADTGENVPL